MSDNTVDSLADETLTPEEIAWEIAKARGAASSAIGHALAYLMRATETIERLRDLGDDEYTVGTDGLDALHWLTDARRAARASLTIAQSIAGTELSPPMSYRPGRITP